MGLLDAEQFIEKIDGFHEVVKDLRRRLKGYDCGDAPELIAETQFDLTRLRDAIKVLA